MKHWKPIPAVVAALAGAALLALNTWAAPPAGAEQNPASRSLVLRSIMRDMGANVQHIAGGIAHEDWPAVEKAAAQLAEHRQPPLAEKVRILGYAGADAGKFKDHDERMQLAARRLGHAASRADGPAVISSFAELQATCLACHQAFRSRFVEHFYGKR
jgi:cytochrome c556